LYGFFAIILCFVTGIITWSSSSPKNGERFSNYKFSGISFSVEKQSFEKCDEESEV
jgi:hypothetical protein